MEELNKNLEEIRLIMAGIEDVSVLMGSSEFVAGSNCLAVMAAYGRSVLDRIEVGLKERGYPPARV